MVDYTKPLDDARLEAAASIMTAWSFGEPCPDGDAAIRGDMVEYSQDALTMLTEARHQTGADALYEALKARMTASTDKEIIAASDACFAALAAYERIAK